ncbi:MAG: hypothetical protein LBQ66_00820 [Planctomycetaceae bacterium]|jgi:ABC-type uncharacterized transport system fused permease/ATPase subunit|nr:hypothetical protein [Planctomycetaceae bacterium]
MKNSKTTSTSATLQKSSKKSWWKLDLTIWFFIVGFVLLTIGVLIPSIVDAVLVTTAGIFKIALNMLDFRQWPWWYFICLFAVIAFSVRWSVFYKKNKNDDFDPLSSEEAKWFCVLSGTITLLIIVLVFLHQFALLRPLFNPLYLWFKFGSISFLSLLILTLIFAAAGFLVFVICRWVNVILDYFG